MDPLRKLEQFALIHLEAPSTSFERMEAVWISEFVFKNFPPEEQEEKVLEFLEKRKSGFPLAYILGTQPFHNLEVSVTPDVLVPRPETEEMVERVLSIVPRSGIGLDLGCGCGAICLALAHALPTWRFDAVDISPGALAVAKNNAAQLRLDGQVDFYLGSWFDPLPEDRSYDLIITNPPYVGTGEEIDLGATFEPPLALFAGEDGLQAYRSILPVAAKRLKKGGLFAGECGPYHGSELIKLAYEAGFPGAKIFRDASGRERFLLALAD
ncbi:peptide chain release factor N(5)-glutamine methyltransferase [bacterium]|nr:peptide chain release factor N(5)-glutamine methyltransferase [bacterium]